ncbi:hypothetical protein JTB14_037471 [Gonioctena quinquepunctata]|nr:hypothetical protein JTB14_037471 [Gonioctena quinquepunctata]
MQLLWNRNKPRETADTELQETSQQGEEEKGENQNTPSIEEHEGVVETQNPIPAISSSRSRYFERKRESQSITTIMNEAINILSIQSKKLSSEYLGNRLPSSFEN